MKIPIVRPASFEKALDLFNRKPRALMEGDHVLFLHCQETAIRTPDPFLASNAFTLSHHTVLCECASRGISIPPCNDVILASLTRELIESGPTWDEEMAKRIRSDYRNFHTVFDGFARKKPHPELVRHNALRAFRIFELLLQHL